MDRYRTRTVEVEAMRLGTTITLGRGEKGKKGDWLIRGPGHHLTVLDDKTFGQRFELVPTTAAGAEPPAKKGRRGGRRKGTKPGRKPRTPSADAPISRGGRKSRYTPEQKEKARQLIEHKGRTITEAVDETGVDYQTLYRWAKTDGWDN